MVGNMATTDVNEESGKICYLIFQTNPFSCEFIELKPYIEQKISVYDPDIIEAIYSGRRCS